MLPTMPSSWMRARQRGISSAINCRNSAGLLPAKSAVMEAAQTNVHTIDVQVSSPGVNLLSRKLEPYATPSS